MCEPTLCSAFDYEYTDSNDVDKVVEFDCVGVKNEGGIDVTFCLSGAQSDECSFEEEAGNCPDGFACVSAGDGEDPRCVPNTIRCVTETGQLTGFCPDEDGEAVMSCPQVK